MGRSDYRNRRKSRYGSAQRSGEALLPGLRWIRNSPLVFGILVGGLLLLASLWALRFQQESATDARRASLRQSVGVAALLIQADLMQAFSVANSLELVVQTAGRMDSFDKQAHSLMLSHPLVTAIALAPGGVIQQVAPTDSHGSLIGRFMFDDPTVSVDLQAAIRKRAMVISRPQQLMTGDVGVIARLPVFRTAGAADNAQGLWGFVLVQVKLPDVAKHLEAVGLTDTVGHYALASTDSDSGERIAFYPLPPPRLAAPESAKLSLPQQQWTLMVESPALAAFAGGALNLIAAIACATVGLAFALWQRHRLIYRARRNFYRESANSLLSDIEIDGAHRVLDRVRHLPGWALLLLVRLPEAGLLGTALLPAGVGIDTPLHSMMRIGDLIRPLGGSSYLIIAHSMENQAIAMRVRDRLVARVKGLPVAGAVLLHHRLLRQPESDIRQLFAEAVAEMHLDAAAARRRRAPAAGDRSFTAVHVSHPPEMRDVPPLRAT